LVKFAITVFCLLSTDALTIVTVCGVTTTRLILRIIVPASTELLVAWITPPGGPMSLFFESPSIVMTNVPVSVNINAPLQNRVSIFKSNVLSLIITSESTQIWSLETHVASISK